MQNINYKKCFKNVLKEDDNIEIFVLPNHLEIIVENSNFETNFIELIYFFFGDINSIIKKIKDIQEVHRLNISFSDNLKKKFVELVV